MPIRASDFVSWFLEGFFGDQIRKVVEELVSEYPVIGRTLDLTAFARTTLRTALQGYCVGRGWVAALWGRRLVLHRLPDGKPLAQAVLPEEASSEDTVVFCSDNWALALVSDYNDEYPVAAASVDGGAGSYVFLDEPPIPVTTVEKPSIALPHPEGWALSTLPGWERDESEVLVPCSKTGEDKVKCSLESAASYQPILTPSSGAAAVNDESLVVFGKGSPGGLLDFWRVKAWGLAESVEYADARVVDGGVVAALLADDKVVVVDRVRVRRKELPSGEYARGIALAPDGRIALATDEKLYLTTLKLGTLAEWELEDTTGRTPQPGRAAWLAPDLAVYSADQGLVYAVHKPPRIVPVPIRLAESSSGIDPAHIAARNTQLATGVVDEEDTPILLAITPEAWTLILALTPETYLTLTQQATGTTWTIESRLYTTIKPHTKPVAEQLFHSALAREE